MDRQDAKFAKNGNKIIKSFLKHFCLKSNPFLATLASWRLIVLLFFLLPFHVLGEEWVFLPVTPLFQPLIGDPREPQTSVISHLSQVRFEGAIGATVELT